MQLRISSHECPIRKFTHFLVFRVTEVELNHFAPARGKIYTSISPVEEFLPGTWQASMPHRHRSATQTNKTATKGKRDPVTSLIRHETSLSLRNKKMHCIHSAVLKNTQNSQTAQKCTKTAHWFLNGNDTRGVKMCSQIFNEENGPYSRADGLFTCVLLYCLTVQCDPLVRSTVLAK